MKNKPQITNQIEIENLVKEFQNKVKEKINQYDDELSSLIEHELGEMLESKSMMEIKSSVFAYYLIIGLLFEKIKVTAIETGIDKDVLEEQFEELKEKDPSLTSSYLSFKSKTNETIPSPLKKDEHLVNDDLDQIYEEIALLNVTSNKDERN
jgi:hypothetical protein